MSVSANTIIETAHHVIGVLAPADAMDAVKAATGFAALNRMMSSFRTSRLTIPYQAEGRYSLVGNTQTYTLGPSGTWNQVRPLFIQGVGLILTGTTPEDEIPLHIYTDQEWRAVQLKTQTSTFPTGVHPQMTSPLITLTFWPKPTQVNDVLIYYGAPFGSFADLSTPYDFPDGYEDALVYQLAKRLSTIYGADWTQDLKDLAADTFMLIKRSNVQNDTLRVDRALRPFGGRYDYRTDTYGGGS